jgi:site-specific DNA recombinase
MTTRKPKTLATAQSVDGDAVLYLRVSSEGQVNTDYNPEGISLPAQRKAAHERAHEIGAPVVTEFIDPGKTAKSIEHRDAFLNMISYLRAHPNVRYVVVYALSRFARNRYDDAIMMATLEKLGVHLISATERNLDDTPAGRAMHGMLAVFNEYQVLVSGEDIKYKMGQKARSGGTLGIAKLGYQNVRIKYDGREIRTIAIDPERAPYVTMAFELYATGQYSFPELRDALTDAGLRTKGNRRYGPRPISIHTIGNLLRDRYYLGTITYDGVEYPGRHEALTTPDLFERVQKILYVERGAGTRERVHDHYLKGTVWCARCKRRLILRPSTSKTGNRYFYYICRGVQEHDCDLPSLPVAKVEKAVTDHYTRVTIPAQHRATLETLAAGACTDSTETTTKLRTNLRRQLTELDRQEDRYLNLLGDPDWPEHKLKAKMRDVRNNKQRITRQLEETTNTLDPGRAVLTAALHLLDRPRDLYDTATEHARKLLNKAIFTRLYLDTNPTRHPTVTTDDLQEPFGSLIHAIRTTHNGQQPPDPQNSTDTRQHDNQTHLGDLLASALAGQSASKAAMVELTGLEPVTPALPVRCATSCATAPKRSPRPRRGA